MIPSEGIEALLDAVEPDIVNGVTGWDTRVGRLSTTKDRCVAIFDRGGRSPEVKVAIDYPSVQIIVRGLKTDYAVSRAKAQQVFDALQAYPTPTDLYPELDSCVALGGITWMGYDREEDRPMWSLNFNLITSTDPIGHRDQ